MEQQHQGIILRMSSEYKSSITLLDEQYGKIEGLIAYTKSGNAKAPSARLFHGALISYTTKKNRSKYTLSDIQLLDMPTYWTGEHFLFFHHVLELADYFLPWDAQATALFRLLNILYTDPEAVGTKRSQKVFLSHFFRRMGIYPEDESVLAAEEEGKDWLRACVNVHPQAASLHTAGFLKTLDHTVEINEEQA